MPSKKKLHAIRVFAVALLMGAAPALAQQSAAPTPSVTTIEITGSRIREPNVTAPAPVTAVSEKELKLEGTTNVENLLNNLPQVTADQSSSQSGSSNGTAAVNLRGLGATRTLVLIDGKRLGPGDPTGFDGAAADLDFVPGPLVESVEVLTGGASTDYGSDAVAGVVNFKLKRDFEGVEIDQQVNVAQHTNDNGLAHEILANNSLSILRQGQNPGPVAVPGDQLDGFTRESTVIMGVNAPNGKGNVTLYATDLHLDPVLQSNRDFSACATTTNAPYTQLECGGSSNNPQGLIYSPNVNDPNPNGYMINPASNPAHPSWIPYDGRLYNYGPTNYLQREDQRYTAGALAHYQVADWADLYGEFMMTDDHTVAQVAPSGLFSGGGPTGNVNINCNNPLMSAQQASIIGCTAGDIRTGADATIIMPGLRFTELGRQYEMRHTDYRMVVGARGDVIDDWTYDVSISYWDSIYNQDYENDYSASRAQNALEVVDYNGKPTCKSALPGGSDPACVPLNIFANGGITAAALKYMAVPALMEGDSQEMVVEGNLSGDFGAWGGKSPWAKDPVAAVVGYDYRYEHLSLEPDEEFQSGDLLSFGFEPPVSGGYDVREEYGELHVPVIQEVTWIKALDLDLGIRHSDYSIYNSANTFSTNTWKVEGDWQPTEDVRFRGGFNKAARAPNIFELFLPTTTISGAFQDPCADVNGGAPSASAAACARTGVTATEYGHIPACPADQCNQTSGGNTLLQPEVAKTWTFGAVVTPTMLPNFTASVDYWNINIANAIQDYGIGGNIVVAECLNGVSSFCSYIHRGPEGILFGGSNNTVDSTAVNAAALSTDGIDVAATYRRDLKDLGLEGSGAITLDLTGTYTFSSVTVPYPGSGSYDCAGLYGLVCQQPTPKWRHKLRVTWETPWEAEFSVLWRHLSSTSFDVNTSNPILSSAGGYVDTSQDAHIAAYDYFDLAMDWQVRPNLGLRFGVNNLFDKDPPLLSSDGPAGASLGNGNTFSSTFDSLGRVFYLGIDAKF